MNVAAILKADVIKKIGGLSQATMQAVDQCLKIALQLT